MGGWNGRSSGHSGRSTRLEREQIAYSPTGPMQGRAEKQSLKTREDENHEP